jgi:predicted ATPase/class 3 adenylate cyclase
VQSYSPAPADYTPPHLAERIRAEQAQLESRSGEGERKTVTALFADIKGSMELIEDLDPEEARSIVDPALALMIDAVHRYEGYVAQSTGDGVFALFGAPLAHEDHPQRAIYAALRMQEKIRAYAEQLRKNQGINLQIRIGLNTGEVVVRSIRRDDLHADYVPIGHSISLAARMEALANPGSILVSQDTHKLAEGYFEFKSLGPARVKGVSDPVNIYEAVGVGPLRTRLERSASRGLARFVGRVAEMDQLRRALQLVHGGQGQIVAAVGEAGVGKSRLFHEFKQTVKSEAFVLEAFSVSHGKASPYLPLTELLNSYFQIAVQDDHRRRVEKITGRVLTLDRNLEDTLPYLFALLGLDSGGSLEDMDPQIKRRRTVDAVKRLLVRESLNQPLILIFEDLHWVDAETETFLASFADTIATTRMLLLVNYRPEYRHAWGSRGFYTQLRLDPLGKENAELLLNAMLGDESDLAPLRKLIIEKTDGNPFYIEEIVQTLFDQKFLVRNGRVALVKTLNEIVIPATVQALLAARIDRLKVPEKELLQLMAVLGKEFPSGLIVRVANQPEQNLTPLLSRLQESEFIYEQPAFPETEYTFKHALTQEVAYNTILSQRRAILHELAGQAIEEMFSDRLEDHIDDLANHYGRSRNEPMAVKYLQMAGERAIQRSAYSDALSHFAAAIAVLESLPDSVERTQKELQIRIAMGPAVAAVKGFASNEAEEVYRRARDLCSRIGETPQIYPVLAGTSSFYFGRGQLREARDIAEQFLNLANNEPNAHARAAAQSLLGTVCVFRGELERARSVLEQSIAYYDTDVSRFLKMANALVIPSRCAHSWALWLLGYPDRAHQRIEEALSLAQQLGRPFSLAHALQHAIALHHFRRDGAVLKTRAKALMSVSREGGFTSWLAAGQMTWGRALAEEGQTEEGIAELLQGLDALSAIGENVVRIYGLSLLSQAYAKAGKIREALETVDIAQGAAEEHEERFHLPELLRLRGELMSASGDSDAAEVSFRRAIDLARSQAARSWELRSTITLARLLMAQQRRDEARTSLTAIYNWFSEGFDTPDLIDTKELLVELDR